VTTVTQSVIKLQALIAEQSAPGESLLQILIKRMNQNFLVTFIRILVKVTRTLVDTIFLVKNLLEFLFLPE